MHFAAFNDAGCWLKGFAHEAPMSSYRDNGTVEAWPGVLDEVPLEFASCLHEPAFMLTDTTFCLWRRRGDLSWQQGLVVLPTEHLDPDGSDYLLSPLEGRPETYRDWAEDYYGRDIDLEAISRVYAHDPITDGLLDILNPSVTRATLRPDIEEIGYPR